MIMTASRIKMLRENNGMSQTQLAKRIGITRSSVNAWELGISVPSAQYIVELSDIFSVSTDYLLCIPNTQSINVDGLTEDDMALVYQVVGHLRQKNSSPDR